MGNSPQRAAGLATRRVLRGGSGGGAVPVTAPDARGRAKLERDLGHPPSDAEIAGLAGARPGDQGVEVNRFGHLIVTAPDGSTFVSYLAHANGEAGGTLVLNVQFHARGTDMTLPWDAGRLAVQAEAAHRLGIGALTTKGRAHAPDQGQTSPQDHWLLPQMGFDTTIQEALHESDRNPTVESLGGVRAPAPPSSFSRATLLHEALTQGDAAAWWRQYGARPHLEFDTTPGSWSRRQLARYIRGTRPGTRGGRGHAHAP